MNPQSVLQALRAAVATVETSRGMGPQGQYPWPISALELTGVDDETPGEFDLDIRFQNGARLKLAVSFEE